jgi:hypothetical protein
LFQAIAKFQEWQSTRGDVSSMDLENASPLNHAGLVFPEDTFKEVLLLGNFVSEGFASAKSQFVSFSC